MGISRSELTTAALDRLATISGLTTYLIDVPGTPPRISDEDLRVRHYVVLVPSAGNPTEYRNQADDVLEHDWTFQLKVVAGDEARLIPVLDEVTAKFEGWQPLNRADVGRCRQISSFDTALKDKAETPPRFWLPLIYRVAVGDPREPETP
jgi:hypothetical protein